MTDAGKELGAKKLIRSLFEKIKKEGKLSFRMAKKGTRASIREDLTVAGYVSPQYSKSRRIQLDPNVLLDNRCITIVPDAPETEAYRILRTQVLQKTAGSQGKTIMITSALPGEGKTITAINLAITFSREFNQTVLLVDCDLRKQTIHEYLGLAGECGLVDYLIDGRPIIDVMIWPGIDKLTLISGGRTVMESAELLGSPKMRELVAEMKGRYPDRFVFFDVPPVLSCADALAFAPLVDSIIVVTKAGSTPIQEVNRALSLLPKEKLFGLVLNQHEQPAAKKYYYPKK